MLGLGELRRMCTHSLTIWSNAGNCRRERRQERAGEAEPDGTDNVVGEPARGGSVSPARRGQRVRGERTVALPPPCDPSSPSRCRNPRCPARSCSSESVSIVESCTDEPRGTHRGVLKTRSSPKLSARPIVQRKTPPNETCEREEGVSIRARVVGEEGRELTSSPNTIADWSFSSVVLQRVGERVHDRKKALEGGADGLVHAAGGRRASAPLSCAAR